MDIDLLKTFVEVNRTRHFARAAENLFVTSAAVSARVKQLESQLGVHLFIRQRGNLRLSLEGERLLPHAETMIAAWARTVQEVQLRPEVDARLALGSTPGIWLLSLQERLAEIRETTPEIAIQAEGHSSEELVGKVMNGTLDLIILYDPPTSTDLTSVKIGELKLGLAASVEGEKLNEATTQNYVYVDWGTAFANFHAKRFGESVVVGLQVNMASIALEILSRSSGAAYLPSSQIASNDFLHAVKGAPSYRRGIHASYRESSERLDTITTILEQVKDLSV
jgi:LysR family transcriptional regulator, flagellar master operon regulator